MINYNTKNVLQALWLIVYGQNIWNAISLFPSSIISVIVRLVSGDTPYEGRVEVYYQDQWGTVCDGSWSIQDANVICRQLGYPPSSQTWQRAHFGEGSGPIILSNVTCDGNESSIDQCDHSGWFNHSCSHQEDVGVSCGEVINVTTPPPGEFLTFEQFIEMKPTLICIVMFVLTYPLNTRVAWWAS